MPVFLDCVFIAGIHPKRETPDGVVDRQILPHHGGADFQGAELFRHSPKADGRGQPLRFKKKQPGQFAIAPGRQYLAALNGGFNFVKHR